ncbi:Beta-lactamase [Planctomycetales bacterium 10988]|nr:Beta-lactamase [Planctomycetales bacterium 10988]
MKRIRSYTVLVWLLFVGGLLAQGAFAADPPFPEVSPAEQGVRAETLREMSAWVRKENYDVRAMLLLRRGHLIFEWYSDGITRDHNHNTFSVTKSVVGTLVGCAIKESKIPSPATTLNELFPNSPVLATYPAKAKMKIADLLTMRGGLPVTRGNKPKNDPQRILFDQVHEAEERNRFVLHLPLERVPGESFAYNNNEPQLIAGILEQLYNEDLLPLGQRFLFHPLNFENVAWRFPDKTGNYPGGYGLRLRALDMAKLGQLYLQQGKWNGEQILSEKWCKEATSDQTGTGYGYYWWTEKGSQGELPFAAKGVRGQRIYVDPQKELVFVLTSDLPQDQVPTITKKLIEGFVLKAVASDSPISEKPGEMDQLKAELTLSKQYRSPRRQGLPGNRLPQAP